VSPSSASQLEWIFAPWFVLGWILKIGFKHLGAPKKFYGPKTCNIWPHFRQLVRRQISLEWIKIFKIRCFRHVHFYHDSSGVKRNKSSELWSTNHGDLLVKSYQPKLTCLEDHISAARGCWIPKVLYVLENDQLLLVHSLPWTWVPYSLYSFFQRG